MKAYTRDDINRMSEKELLNLINEYLDKYEDNEAPIMREITDQRQIYFDILKASSGKRDKRSVKNFIGTDLRYQTFLDDTSKINKAVRNIQVILATDQYKTRTDHQPVKIIKDGKVRTLTVPFFSDEHIIQHAVIRVILPRLTKGMYTYTCASIPGRGVHYARKAVEKAITNDPKNCRYCLKMDIRHFFDSIPHRELKKKIKNIVKEPTIRHLIFRLIDVQEKGLPLGFYTSPWFANFFLQDIDHYIKERILDDCGCNTERTGRHGAVYYYRYMDDIAIFGPSKKELHKIKNKIDEILQTRYNGMRIKYDWQVFRFDYVDKNEIRKGRPLDFVGFKFYHDHITIRKKTYKRIMRLIHKMKKKKIYEVTFHEAAAMLSYYGFIYWSDAKKLYSEFLKPYVTIKALKKIVREEFQRRRKELSQDQLYKNRKNAKKIKKNRHNPRSHHEKLER